MPSDPLPCVDVVDELASAVDGSELPPATTVHVAACLRCQAEVAKYRRLGQALRELAEAPPEVPPSLENDILATIDREGGGLHLRVPAAAAALGGIAAAAGVIALATRGVTRQRRVARLAV